tara:strand:- start:2813 stop:4915 length:2103 start_codon:yes stop_codon:yes gene_type:complete
MIKNKLLIFLFLLSFLSCESQNEKMKKEHKYTNNLINESSPYLLQHAHNPVNWYPWNETTLKKAQKENKLILISIGYAACHWCHVMEEESFEDEEIAKIMNENFICIKVDREERPDVDQIYMNAVQILNQRGGWPLNCFALPTGEPIWGGTYFQKENWKNILLNIDQIFQQEPDKFYNQAEQLTEAIKKSEAVKLNVKKHNYNKNLITEIVEKWKQDFDKTHGGNNRSPKFPIPNTYKFLIKYAHLFQDKEIKNIIDVTLTKMAYGGIFDQIGGGFARYSTDIYWKIPHFEKMLYDNGQLVSLYSQAYQLSKNPIYKEVVFKTLNFINREMTNKNGGFFSSLDADSEGEEGKYYVWKEKELKEILKTDYEIISSYYNVNNKGLWENGNYILLINKNKKEIANKFNISLDELNTKIEDANKKLLNHREKRIKPGLDDKILTSWNAIMLNGYLDAYMTFNEEKFLVTAVNNGEFLIKNMIKEDGEIFHNYKNGKISITGFLEDYAFCIEAFIKLYECTFEEKWLKISEKLLKYCFENFTNEENKMFYFTSKKQEKLIARKMELYDNVIPASNSSIAISLFKMYKLTNDKLYHNRSLQMLNNIIENMDKYPGGHSNWLTLYQYQIFPFYQIILVGENSIKLKNIIDDNYIPNKIFAGSKNTKSELNILQKKYIENKTYIYVCVDNACLLPVTNTAEAVPLITF